MTPLQKKFIFWALNVLGVVLLLIIIILTPCMTEIQWVEEPLDKHSLEVVIMVIVPFLLATNAFTLAQHFVCYNFESALAQLEKQFKNHTIDMSKYKEMYKHIIDFEMEKRTLRARVEAEKQNNKEQIKKKIEKAKEKIIAIA